jgi:peptidylprolyl isomerase
MLQAVQGNKVKVHFTGKTQDGSIFASSLGNEPLEFKIGGGEVLPGIENAIIGMKVGDKKITILQADDAYGPRNDELVFDIEKSQLPEGIPTEIGECLEFHYADGTILLLTIIGIHESMLKVDANHPLAGKNLTFEIELVSVN